MEKALIKQLIKKKRPVQLNAVPANAWPQKENDFWLSSFEATTTSSPSLNALARSFRKKGIYVHRTSSCRKRLGSRNSPYANKQQMSNMRE